MKKVLLYSPYLHILGGGERHILSILQVFDRAGYQVDIVWDDIEILDKIEKRLHLTFKNAQIISNFFLTATIAGKLKRTHQYDYFFYVTDGSYFLSKAKHNYIFAMYPQAELYDMKFINRLKLFNFSIISNGSFTAEYIDRWFGKKPAVIHPYIDDDFLRKSSLPKKNIILSVGRFYDHLHSKRQDILIEAFTKLQKKHKEFSDYTLVLAGGADEADRQSLKSLMTLAKKDKNIKFIVNPSFDALLELYRDAHIYWHAAGYGVDEKKEPYKVEHLGITPLEALASGCIVFAHNSGGPKRLLSEGQTGFLYNSIDELIDKTAEYLRDKDTYYNMQRNGREFITERFSYNAFEDDVKQYFRI
jgi:glycosyltransferase involved in cell wall biosynthesis